MYDIYIYMFMKCNLRRRRHRLLPIPKTDNIQTEIDTNGHMG